MWILFIVNLPKYENYSSISATNQRQISGKMYQCSLGNRSRSCQRFVDAAALFFAPGWSERLFKFENVVQIAFEPGPQTSDDVRFCQTEWNLQNFFV